MDQYIVHSKKYIYSLKDKYTELPNIDSKYIVKKYKKISHEIDNPWISIRDQNLSEKKKSKLEFIGLLNKISEKNFNKILDLILKLKIEEDGILVDILYNKCIQEVQFMELYILLLQEMIKQWHNIIDLFITKCKIDYNSMDNDETLSNLLLVGILYNKGILDINYINSVFDKLIEKKSNISIELFCKLFIKIYDKYSLYDNFLSRLNKVKENDNLNSKNKFLLMDINDLMSNKKVDVKKDNKKKSNSCKNSINSILKEYLEILDTNEVIECYDDLQYDYKDIILCDELLDMLIRERQQNKKFLKELITFLLEKNYINNDLINNKIKKLLENKKELQLDYPNIYNDISYLKKLNK
jgi:hypothetical protein